MARAIRCGVAAEIDVQGGAKLVWRFFKPKLLGMFEGPSSLPMTPAIEVCCTIISLDLTDSQSESCPCSQNMVPSGGCGSFLCCGRAMYLLNSISTVSIV